MSWHVLEVGHLVTRRSSDVSSRLGRLRLSCAPPRQPPNEDLDLDATAEDLLLRIQEALGSNRSSIELHVSRTEPTHGSYMRLMSTRG